MWRLVACGACCAVVYLAVQSQVAGLMAVPGQAGGPANGQRRTWMLFPLPANPKQDPQAMAKQRAEKKGHELANLLRPFAKPHPFEAASEGYKIVFPGKPTMPMFYEITRQGTTWYYKEERLGNVTFTATWDKAEKFRAGQSDRELLDWWKGNYKKEMERLHGDDKRWMEIERYFRFQNRFEAVELNYHYHFSTNDDYYGSQLCRRWFILKGENLYRLTVEGNAEVVSSRLADDFFKSFELRPKVVKGK